MAKGKIGIDFSEFEILSKQLKSLNGNIKKTTETALKKSKVYVNKNLVADMNKHNKTSATIRSLDKTTSVNWVGSLGSIPVGFNIGEGGLASIFLMYGTPRMSKDQKLYNDVYGSKNSEEVAKIQADVFFDEIGKLMGG